MHSDESSQQPHSWGWTYFQYPKTLHEAKPILKGTHLLDYSAIVPENAKQVKFWLFVQTGNTDQDTYQTIKVVNDGTPAFKHYVGIHPYHSNAWSYTNDTFVAPISTTRKIYIELQQAKGSARITLKIIGYK